MIQLFFSTSLYEVTAASRKKVKKLISWLVGLLRGSLHWKKKKKKKKKKKGESRRMQEKGKRTRKEKRARI